MNATDCNPKVGEKQRKPPHSVTFLFATLQLHVEFSLVKSSTQNDSYSQYVSNDHHINGDFL